MQIRIKFFAAHREFVGKSELTMELPEQTSVTELMKILFEKFPELKRIEDETILSVNKLYAEQDMKLKEGDEVALFPPIGGG